MKRKNNNSASPLIAIMAGLAISTTVANAQGTFTDNGATQPVFDGADQGYFNPNSPSTAGNLDKWFYENSGAGQPKGQTFTVTSPVQVKAMSYRLGSTNKPPTVNYLVRIGAVDTATNTFYPLHSETITQTTNWGIQGVTTDSIGTWTLESPVTLPALPAGTVYGFDLTMTSNTTAWQQGIPYPLSENTNVFAGGAKYTTPLGGAAGIPTNTMQMDSGRDREFHLDMDATTITDTTKPTLTSIDDQVGGGPIYEDQVQVAYILNFDEAIDETTIDLADFENLGSGVSLDSVVSVTQTTPFPLASSIRVVFGISGTGTLQLGVANTSDIADHYTNTLNSPVVDDTTITVNAGTNPDAGNRWWDGTTTTGITDGVSQGGTATWDTTTTNWDRGFGFASPVAWNNASGDTAIFGGTAGTVTLDNDITLNGLTVSLPAAGGAGYSIGVDGENNTLNFPAPPETPGLVTVTATGNGSNQDTIIRAGIAGAPTMNIAGRNDNNANHFQLLPGADVTQTIGTLNMLNTLGSNKRLILGGPGTGNVVDQVTWTVTGNQLQVRKQDSTNGGADGSSWTINQDISLDDGRIFVDEGTLILGGTDNFCSHSIEIGDGGRIVLQGNWRIHDENEDFRVLSGGIVAPGGSVGTVTFNWNSSRGDPSVGLVDLRTGSTYEWEVGAGVNNTDVIALTEPVVGGNAELVVASGTTLKVINAGGSPSVSDKLTVFTYASGVVAPDAATLNANMTIDLSGTTWTGTPSFGVDIDGVTGDGTIYVTGIDSGGGPANPYTAWASVNAPSGTPADDFDGDGVSNAIEFALGGLASTNDLDKLPTVADDGTNMTFTFVRDQDSADPSVSTVIEVGTDLAAWPTTYTVGADTGSSTAGVTVTDNADGTDTVVLSVAKAPDAKKFARLKVVVTP